MSKPKDHNRIDEVIHQRTRLAIMAALAGVDRMAFNELKAELGLTDGNLSTHAAALERAGYVQITKVFKGKKPNTTLAMTQEGREAMAKYVAVLKSILDTTGGNQSRP